MVILQILEKYFEKIVVAVLFVMLSVYKAVDCLCYGTETINYHIWMYFKSELRCDFV